MPELDQYLADLDTRLDLSVEAREEVLRELRGHLLSSVQDRVAAGSDESRAVRHAIGDFGQPGHVATAINRAYDESGGNLPLANILALTLFPEADTRREKLRLARMAVQALLASTFLLAYVIGLPTWARYTSSGPVRDLLPPLLFGIPLLMILLVLFARYVSERLDGLTLRALIQVVRVSEVTVWFSSLLCAFAVYYGALNPGGFIATIPWLGLARALTTGTNFLNLVFPALLFVIIPSGYSFYLRRELTALRRKRA